MTDADRYDITNPVYDAYKAILEWQPRGWWNKWMRRGALVFLSRITIFGGRPRG